MLIRIDDETGEEAALKDIDAEKVAWGVIFAHHPDPPSACTALQGGHSLHCSAASCSYRYRVNADA